MPLRAQTVENITLQEAINIALENNFQLKQATNNVELSRTQVWGEKADYLPSLNSSIGASRNSGRQFNQATGDFGDFTINDFRASLSTSVPIFNGFENINSLRSAEYGSRSLEENREWVRENIIFQTASNYLQLLLDKELLQIARENLETSYQQLEQVQAQVEVGSRPTVDLYNQEAIVASNELDVTNRENALGISRLRLIRTLQIDPRKEYEFTTPEIQADQLIREEFDLSKLISAALENRSDLRSEQFNIQALEYQLKATRSLLYPSLSLSASLSSSYNDRNFNPETAELFTFSDQFLDQNINRSIGLSLNIPIFNNLDRQINVESQKVNYKNALLSLENTRLQVMQEVNQAYSDYQAILKELEFSEKALRAAERSYLTQKERYEVGAGTLIELSQANAQYIEAQSDRTSAVYNYVFQKKILDYYVGKLDENVSLN